MNSYHYSLDELDMMMPWEREIYTIILLQTLEEEKKAREEAKQKAK